MAKITGSQQEPIRTLEPSGDVTSPAPSVAAAAAAIHPLLLSQGLALQQHMQQLLRQQLVHQQTTNAEQLEQHERNMLVYQKQQHEKLMADLGRKQLESLLQQLQEQLQLNLIQQSQLMHVNTAYISKDYCFDAIALPVIWALPSQRHLSSASPNNPCSFPPFVMIDRVNSSLMN